MSSSDATPPPTLVTLDEELLLLILERVRRGFAAVTYCRLAQTCQFFHEASSLSTDDESLTEMASRMRVAHALASPERPDGLKPFRSYTRAPGESHKAVLHLLEMGLLTRGVLHDVPESAIVRTGWKLAYAAPYSHRTSDADLDGVPASARHVLVAAIHVGPATTNSISNRVRSLFGGQRNGGDVVAAAGAVEAAVDGGGRVFHLLAWGQRETVLRVTHDEHEFEGMGTTSANEEDSVFWYRWAAHSFGFSSHPQLWLWAADAGIKQRGEEERPDDRLSWNLDLRSTGGWRAGRVIDLGRSSEWEKRLYYR